MLKNKHVLLLAVLVTLIFSYHNIRLLFQEVTVEDYTYMPIRYSDEIRTDDFVTYARINEVFSGGIIHKDPDTFENKNTKSHNITLFLSDIATSIGGLFSKNIKHAFFFNLFLFPIFNFLLLFYFSMLLTRNRLFSIFAAVFVLFFYRYMQISIPYLDIERAGRLIINQLQITNYQLSDFWRTPNILFSNIIFSLFTIFLYKYVWNNDRYFAVLSGVFLGLSAYTYLPMSVAAYSIATFGLIFHFGNKKMRNDLLWCIMLGLIISLYSFYIIIWQNLTITPYYLDIKEGSTLIVDRPRAALLFLPSMFYLINGLVVALLLPKGKFKRMNTGFIFGAIVAMIFLQFITGKSGRVAYRGFLPLYMVIVLSLIPYLWDKIYRKEKIELSILNHNIVNICFFFGGIYSKIIGFFNEQKKNIGITIISIIMTLALLIQFINTERRIEAYNDERSILDLVDWLKENTNKNDVVLTLDSELILLLPVYSHNCNYIPMRLRSVTPKQERMQRLYESFIYFNITPEVYEYILKNMKSHASYLPSNDILQYNLNLFNLAVFYREFVYNDITEDLIALHKKNYEAFYINKNHINLSFRADYLVVSDFYKQLAEKFKLSYENINIEMLFKNNHFQVYKIN